MKRLAWAGAAACAALVGWPVPAQACGGFCQTLPMEQAGEDIVYAKDDDGTLTMIVRIAYMGAADEFAWILPVPVEPELDVSTDALFTALATSTAPQFVISGNRVEGTCRAEPRCDYPSYSSGFGCGASYAAPTESRGLDAGVLLRSDAGSGVTVLSQELIGPYESVVRRGSSATELQAWLTEHGYDIPESSIPLMEDYVAAGQLFVALRLRANASTSSIRPLVLRMQHEEPCLPIRLTAIATVPDMPITAYFLSDRPAVPTNYSLLDPPVDSQLWTRALGWPTAYANAIDDAGGQAFVLDYAGATPELGLALPSVSHLASASVQTFFQELRLLGYPNDPDMLALITRFLTPPRGQTVRDYVNACFFGGCAEPTRWNPAGLVAAIEEELRVPRAEAEALLSSHPVLTRLYTSMSAEEMTLDPEFRFDDGIERVSNVHEATQVSLCDAEHFLFDAPTELELPDGRRLALSPGRVQDADAYCRARGASGVDRGGCTAALGSSAGSRSTGALLTSLLAALVWRARRKKEPTRPRDAS